MRASLRHVVDKLGLDAGQRHDVASAAADLEDATPWYVTALAGFGTWIGALLVGIGLALSSLFSDEGARVMLGCFLLVLAPVIARASKHAAATQAALIAVVAGQVLFFTGLDVDGTARLATAFVLELFVIAAINRPLTRGMATLAALSSLVGLCERLEFPVDVVPLIAVAVGVAGFLVEPLVLRQPWSRVVRPVATACLLAVLGFWTFEAAAANLAHTHSPFIIAAPALHAIAGAAGLLAIAIQQRVKGMHLVGVVVAVCCAAALSLSLPGLMMAFVVVVTGIAVRAKLLTGVATAFVLFFLWLTYWRLDVTLLDKALWSSAFGVLLFVVRAVIGHRGGARVPTFGGRRVVQARRDVVAVVAAACVFVAVIGGLVISKERTLANGRRVLLPLLPADPRSLAQGDYMRLRTELATAALKSADSAPDRGSVVVVVDENDVGRFASFDRGDPLQPNEVRMRYRVTDKRWSKQIHIGAQDMFFEEGQSKRFDQARYGEVRIDDGDVVLVGLCDADRKPL
ncbi:MAG: GDYXXLXY domain-containing protein [Deltaproteobacteria bacterium]|nr:GDYXXLXY domain-containing protein [Deltaproteobacteria bacterium]